MVNTVEDAKNAIRYARYPPIGERGVGGPYAHLGFKATKGEYVLNANNEIMVAIQIETKEAVENIEAIVEVEGIDLVFIGPSDLHMSLGLPLRVWSESHQEGGKVFLEAVEKVKKACARKGIPMGIFTLDGKSGRNRAEEGFKFVGVGSDGILLLAHSEAEAALAKGVK